MSLREYGSSFSLMILLLAGGQFHISKSFEASIQLSTLIILSLPNYEYHHVWPSMLVLYTNVLCLHMQRAWFVKYPRGEIVFSYFFQRFVFTKCLCWCLDSCFIKHLLHLKSHFKLRSHSFSEGVCLIQGDSSRDSNEVLFPIYLLITQISPQGPVSSLISRNFPHWK